MNNLILKNKLIPVVVIKDIKDARPTLDALKEGGIKVVEITYRTTCAPEVIKIAINEYPSLLVGAGTVISKEQALQAIELGAKFIVSPGLSKEIASLCKEKNIDYVPGIVTPTEIMEALSLGYTYLKFFPANAFGGLKTIKALSGPFPQVKFMPTGGVDNSNLKEFLDEKAIFAIGGSWLLKGDIINTCKEAVKIVKGE